MTQDCIYILSNPSIRGIKIGRTANGVLGVKARMKELQTTGVPDKFVCEFAALVDNSSILEKELHAFLSEYRTSSNREFFEIDSTLAKFLIEIRVKRDLIEVTPEVVGPRTKEKKCFDVVNQEITLAPVEKLGVPPGYLSFSDLLSRYIVSKQTMYNRLNAIGMKKSISQNGRSYYSLGQVEILDQITSLLRQGYWLSQIIDQRMVQEIENK
jgi:hypothetical protein